MQSAVDYQQSWQNIVLWLQTHVWTPDTLIQVCIILGAFALSTVFYHLIENRLVIAIEKAEIPVRIKRIVNNLYKLLMPVTALGIIFLLTMFARSEMIGMNTMLNVGVMKLLFAWIILRIALQFVANSLIRNILTMGILTIAALSIFGVLDETSVALDAIGFNFGKIRFSALSIIKGVMSIFILLYLALFASTFLERRILKSRSLTRSSQVLVVKVLRVVLIVFALMIGVTSAGIDLSVFTVFLGTIGLGIGFGLQKVISNLFSGMLLLMDKSITPGDIIELEKSGTFGWVNHMAARYTEVVTRDNKSYLIPNEDFITQRVINWSHGNRLIRLDVKFSVRAESNPHDVIRIADEAAKKPERVVDAPEPSCSLIEFSDNSMKFSLTFWIKDAEQGVGNVKGEVLLSLWDAFRENNIHIAQPLTDILLQNIKKPEN